MKNLSELYLWAIALCIFIGYRLFSDNLLVEGSIVGAIFFAIGMYWFVVPFFLGRDIELPSFQSGKIKKGEHNPARILLCTLGLFLVYVGLVA